MSTTIAQRIGSVVGLSGSTITSLFHHVDASKPLRLARHKVLNAVAWRAGRTEIETRKAVQDIKERVAIRYGHAVQARSTAALSQSYCASEAIRLCALSLSQTSPKIGFRPWRAQYLRRVSNRAALANTMWSAKCSRA